jgi:predicted regulator of Ras-like GTPase activity (Roadblock/LC7/MglB family)
MSFTAMLRDIVDGCGGGIGAALMGNDGIPIEQVTAQEAHQMALAEDIATAGTEFSRILEEIRKASDAVSGGGVQETTIVLASVTLVFRTVDDETFLVVALLPDGNLGKARYLIRKQLIALRRELLA